MDILIGLLLILTGISLATSGLRVFLLLLPTFAFIAGFFLGAAFISSLMGDGFLSTVTGWIVGLVVGAFFSFISYAYWYIGAILGAGSVGASIAVVLMALIGIESSWIVWIVAAIAAVIAAFIALSLELPLYLVIVQTAIGGALAIILGLLLVFNQVDLEGMRWGIAREAVRDSWLWWIAAVVISAVGIGLQNTRMQQVRMPVERWIRADAAARQMAAASNDRETRVAR
jgi:hypothetical protein